MTDFLLALAIVLTLLLGHWIMSRLDLYLNSVKIDEGSADTRESAP